MSKRKESTEQATRPAEEETIDDPQKQVKKYDRLLTSGQVSRLFFVARSTVWRWAAEGKIPSVRCPSGMRKIRFSDIQRVLDAVVEESIVTHEP